MGTYSYLGATLEKAGISADPSVAHVRQLLTETAILPLGSQYLHERLQPHTKAVGGLATRCPPGTTGAVHCCCGSAG
jgi:hypothetical protein